MDQKYVDRANYLIKHGYVTGTDVDTLADKLHSIDNNKDITSIGVMTRESVYGKENVDLVQKIVNGTDQHKKTLIPPGERISAAIDDPTD